VRDVEARVEEVEFEQGLNVDIGHRNKTDLEDEEDFTDVVVG